MSEPLSLNRRNSCKLILVTTLISLVLSPITLRQDHGKNSPIVVCTKIHCYFLRSPVIKREEVLVALKCRKRLRKTSIFDVAWADSHLFVVFADIILPYICSDTFTCPSYTILCYQLVSAAFISFRLQTDHDKASKPQRRIDRFWVSWIQSEAVKPNQSSTASAANCIDSHDG